MIEDWVRPDYHLKVTELKPRDEGRGKRAIRAALRFDPWQHPVARRAGIVVHVLRGRPLIFRTHLLVSGGVELKDGGLSDRLRLAESSLTRVSPALLTLPSGISGVVMERTRFDGGTGGTGIMFKGLARTQEIGQEVAK